MYDIDDILINPILYLNSVYLINRYMNNHKNGFNLNIFMYFYNSFQILFNAYIVYGLCDIPYKGIINIPYSDRIKYFVFLHYISKYIDYLDTLVIILRKKNNQLSFLHIYHHSTVSIIWGLLLHIGHGNGTASFGCLLNSLIHVIMYSHYLITSFGINNPFKKYITQMQLAQFLILFIHSIVVMCNYEKYFPIKYAIIQFIYQLQMIVLFSNFYRNSYKNLKIKENV